MALRPNGRPRYPPGADRKPLVLSTYLDAQEHLPYADDSNAVTPMSEENGAIIIPVYYANLGNYNLRFLFKSTLRLKIQNVRLSCTITLVTN